MRNLMSFARKRDETTVAAEEHLTPTVTIVSPATVIPMIDVAATDHYVAVLNSLATCDHGPIHPSPLLLHHLVVLGEVACAG